MRTKRIVAIGFSILAISFYACNGDKDNKGAAGMSRQTCIDSMNAIDSKLKNITTPDPVSYGKAITAWTNFATNFPNDTLAPVCLFRAASFASSLNQYQRALSLYDTIAKKYPNFYKAAECAFSHGNIYEDKMKDTAKARVYYQLVLDKYPKDQWAMQARFALKNLGKTPDEIINSFPSKDSDKDGSGTK